MVETIFGDTSEAYLDPATGKGLRAGLLQTLFAGLLLALLVVLAVLESAIDPATVTGGRLPAAAFGGAAGALLGAGSIARLHYRATPPAYMRRPRWRLASIVAFVAGYWLLLVTVPASAVPAGGGYVLGRLAAHLLVYAAG